MVLHPCCFPLQPHPPLMLFSASPFACSPLLQCHQLLFPDPLSAPRPQPSTCRPSLQLRVFTVQGQLLLLPLSSPLPSVLPGEPRLRLLWAQGFREADTSKCTEPVPSCPSGPSTRASCSESHPCFLCGFVFIAHHYEKFFFPPHSVSFSSSQNADCVRAGLSFLVIFSLFPCSALHSQGLGQCQAR